MLAYSFYVTDSRVMRYAEALAERGDRVDVFALRTREQGDFAEINGVRIYRIQKRVVNESGRLSYLVKL